MFRKHIRDNYDRLTPSFRRLGEYLIDNYFDAAFMTASQLAKQLDIDPATVVRFSQRLGYRGYPELLADVRAAVRDELERVYVANVREGTPHDTMLKIIAAERSNLERLESQLTPEGLDDLFQAFESAKRIFVVSQWVGFPLAQMFATLLRSAGLEATAIEASTPNVVTALHDVGEGDVVFSLSLADVGPDMGTALTFARDKGARTFSIATWGSSSAARAAETVFVTPGRTPTNYPSFAMAALFVSSLFQMLLARRAEQSEQVLASMRAAREQVAKIRSKWRMSQKADELWD